MNNLRRSLVVLALFASGCTVLAPHAAGPSASLSLLGSGGVSTPGASTLTAGASTTTDARAAWAAVAPILQACAGCHNGVVQTPDLRTYAAVMASGTVVPGNSAGSLLYQVVTGTSSTVPQMPPSAPLSVSDQQAIGYWIAAGANNAAPTVVVSAPDPTAPSATPTPAPVALFSSRVPDADTIGARLVMGLESHVTLDPQTTTGKQFVAMYGALPQQTDPNAATGLDQVPLLVYTACTAVTPATYAVVTKNSAASNKAALVAAGLRMVDLHVGGLLTADASLNAQATTIFGNLVDQDVTAGATATGAFVSVCMAANTFGTVMKGF